MNYKNGRDVLPPSLLKELQTYIQGELIYIPKCGSDRAGWGELSGSRHQLAIRNEEIYNHYSGGASISQLEREYHLSGESIRKIIIKTRVLLNDSHPVKPPAPANATTSAAPAMRL